jgi:nicotinamidase-related amidase
LTKSLSSELAHTALLIIDVQQALCSGEHAAFEAGRVIERINEVARKARAAGAVVVVIQHESVDGELLHGSSGWQLADGLETRPSDLLLRKTATDSFHRTELHDVLQARGVGRLVICGFQSEFCVDTTTRRALALGYPAVLVSDAHSTCDNGVLTAAQITAHHNRTLSEISSFGPRVVTVRADDVQF